MLFGKRAYAYTVTGILLILLTISLVFVMSKPEILEKRFSRELTTTTNPIAVTTTTLEIPEDQMVEAREKSEVVTYADEETVNTIAWMEKYTFDLVNLERINRGLPPLKWNAEITSVCRLHSEDMADNNFFEHEGSDGSNTSFRLMRGEVYYWNLSGENIAKVSEVDTYSVNLRGETVDIDFKDFKIITKDAIIGWMESTYHRENILREEFNEAGMGIIKKGEFYFFTQDFIRRVDCGYKDGSCCETEGYYPWCYSPWECNDSVCE